MQGLRYVTDREPGIRRVRRGSGFGYIGADGRALTDPRELRRIRQLAIPPAYEDVWICVSANGHLQATGRDARGRKQYRYHPLWRAQRDSTKFHRMLEFGRVLPRIRRLCARHLALPGLPREKVLAAIVKLLQTTLVRVGNEEYARANGSFGLTTLRDRHVRVRGETLRLEFRGKSGVQHSLTINDPVIARIVRRLHDLPGQELFQWIDAAGERHRIDSSDVNEYVRSVSGDDFTAKDFRTWFATVHALEVLSKLEAASQSEAKRQVVECVRAVALRLGNTPTVCRKCYIHPAVLEAHLAGGLAAVAGRKPLAALTQLLRGVRRASRPAPTSTYNIAARLRAARSHAGVAGAA